MSSFLKPSNRFFVDFELKLGKVEIKDTDFVYQLKKVLRKKVGDKIVLFTNNLKEAEAEIINFYGDLVELEILAIRKNIKEPTIEISLYCSTLKRGNFDFVVQKATEIGIKKIIPIICKNTVKLGLNLNRLKKIAKEAAEQSGRGVIPEVSLPQGFKEAIDESNPFELKILFDAYGKKLTEKYGKKLTEKTFNKRLKKISKIAIFIGPEGGWSDEEIELAKKKDFYILSLGKLNLRAETAAIAGSFLTVYYFDFLNKKFK